MDIALAGQKIGAVPHLTLNSRLNPGQSVRIEQSKYGSMLPDCLARSGCEINEESYSDSGYLVDANTESKDVVLAASCQIPGSEDFSFSGSEELDVTPVIGVTAADCDGEGEFRVSEDAGSSSLFITVSSDFVAVLVEEVRRVRCCACEIQVVRCGRFICNFIQKYRN